MIVVADTSPLNYLVQIRQVTLLHHLFSEVIVPHAVAMELTDPAAPAAVRAFASDPPAWCRILSIRSTDLSLPRLGAGETEAISLALELHADLLLCDDGDARRAAVQRAIRVTGTLGVLEFAAAQGLIDLPTCIDQLRRTTMRMPEGIVTRMLADDRARRQARQ